MKDRFRMTDAKVERPVVVDVDIEFRLDDWTTPRDFDCYSDEQLAAWDRGEWQFVGITAVASCIVPIDGVGIRQSISSGGLWGVENNSDRDYLVSIAREQVADVYTVCDALGISHEDDADDYEWIS